MEVDADGAVVVTMSNPPVNALHPRISRFRYVSFVNSISDLDAGVPDPVIAGLKEKYTEAIARDDVKVIVVTGEHRSSGNLRRLDSGSPNECEECHKILMESNVDGADSAEDSGSSQQYKSTLPGIPKGCARQLFQNLEAPVGEYTSDDALNARLEKIISIWA